MEFHISIFLNYIGVIICIILYLIKSPRLFINNFLGGIFLFLIFILVRIISHNGLGLGDIHYSFFCGLISGIPGFIFSALSSSMIGIIVFLLIKIFSKNNKIMKTKIPFIPVMFIGTIISLLIMRNTHLNIFN